MPGDDLCPAFNMGSLCPACFMGPFVPVDVLGRSVPCLLRSAFSSVKRSSFKLSALHAGLVLVGHFTANLYYL